MEARSSHNTLALGSALLGSVLAVVLFSSTGQDDCHITFWSAWSLSELGEILNHSGERVEQSSSLFHTVLLAILHRVSGAPLPWLGYGVGILAAIAAILRLRTLASAMGWELRRGSLLLLSTSPAFAYWQLGALESSLFTWACVEFLIGLARLHTPVAVEAADAAGKPAEERPGGPKRRFDLPHFVVWSGVLAALRPEAGLLAMAVAGVLYASSGVSASGRKGASFRRAGIGFGVPTLAFASLTAFRLAYFDRPFPQPVVAKMGGAHGLTTAKLSDGLVYLGDRLASWSGGLLVVGLLVGACLCARDLRAGARRRVGPAVLVLGYSVFIVLSGGDWMKGWRFVAHVEPLMLFLLLFGLSELSIPSRAWALLCTAVLVLNLHGLLEVGGGSGTGRPIWTAWQVDPAVRAFANAEATWPERANQVHTRDVVMVDEMNGVIGRLLEHTDHVRILSKQAGLITFYAAREYHGRIEFIDRLGLSSRHFDELKRELDLATGPMGLAWELEDFFRAGQGRSEPCFRPDVIFDLHRLSATLVEELDYMVVYEQAGLAHGRSPGEEDRRARALGPAPMDLLRVRPQRGLFDGISPWSEETNMYQFIAVRGDLARRAGLVSVAEVRLALGPQRAATAQTLYWDDARRPFLRGRSGADGERPGLRNLPVVERFELELSLEERGARVIFDTGPEDGPRAVSAVWALVEGSAPERLRDGEHFVVEGMGTPKLAIELDRTRLPAAVRLRIAGLRVGGSSAEVMARLAP